MPSLRAVALISSSPTTAMSSSVATLSLTVSIATMRSRTDIDTSSCISEIPTGPGVRSSARIRLRERPLTDAAAIEFSKVRATWIFITDAGVTRSSSWKPASGPPATGAA